MAHVAACLLPLALISVSHGLIILFFALKIGIYVVFLFVYQCSWPFQASLNYEGIFDVGARKLYSTCHVVKARAD